MLPNNEENKSRYMCSLSTPLLFIIYIYEYKTEVSTGQDFLSCPASYLRPGGRQDRTKIKNASGPTGHDTRTACPVLSSDTEQEKNLVATKRTNIEGIFVQ